MEPSHEENLSSDAGGSEAEARADLAQRVDAADLAAMPSAPVRTELCVERYNFGRRSGGLRLCSPCIALLEALPALALRMIRGRECGLQVSRVRSGVT